MGLSPSPEPAAVARGYLESFATADPDIVAAFVTDDFVNEHTAALGSGCIGREEYRRRLPSFIGSMPRMRYEIEDLIAEGDRVGVAYTLHAVVNDRPVAVRGFMRFRIRDGRIAHRVDYWDSQVFQHQAGLE